MQERGTGHRRDAVVRGSRALQCLVDALLDEPGQRVRIRLDPAPAGEYEPVRPPARRPRRGRAAFVEEARAH